MNGIIHYLHDYYGQRSWSHDDKPSQARWRISTLYYKHETPSGRLVSWFIEGSPSYLNPYPFEIGDDRPPLSVPAEEQLRFAMSVVSNHSERVQIAALCATQSRHIAKSILDEYERL